MPSLESLVSSDKLRKILKLSRSGEHKMRVEGKLPAPIKIGKRNFYMRNELEAALGLSPDNFEDGAKS